MIRISGFIAKNKRGGFIKPRVLEHVMDWGRFHKGNRIEHDKDEEKIVFENPCQGGSDSFERFP